MGNELFKKVTKNTGLPEDLVAKELEALLNEKGINKSEVTLDELRATLSEYLKEVIIDAKEAFELGIDVEEEIDPEKLGE